MAIEIRSVIAHLRNHNLFAYQPHSRRTRQLIPSQSLCARVHHIAMQALAHFRANATARLHPKRRPVSHSHDHKGKICLLIDKTHQEPAAVANKDG